MPRTMTMTIDQRIACLKAARKEIRQAAAGIGIPQLESILRDADMTLHWALWNFGEIDELRPELEFRQDDSSPDPRGDDLRAAE
jgi:hypothetical protein